MSSQEKWFLNARVYCPYKCAFVDRHIFVNDTHILDVIEPCLLPQEIYSSAIDLKGQTVLPGFVEPALVFRDPGREHEESFGETLEKAQKGNFRTVVARPDSYPAIDDSQRVKESLQRADALKNAQTVSDYAVMGALTKSLEHKEMADLAHMAQSGAIGFSDGGVPIENLGLLRDIAEYAAHLKLPLHLTPASLALAREGVVHEGKVSTLLGLKGIAACSESSVVAVYVELARQHGLKLLIGPLSSRQSVRYLSMAQDDGLSVMGLVSCWHLLHTEDDLLENPYDAAWNFSPPLRSFQDQEALRCAVKEKRLLIQSDHRPMASMYKNCEFALSQPGRSCIDRAFSLLKEDEKGLEMGLLVEAMALSPARFWGFEDRGVIQKGMKNQLGLLANSVVDPLS